MKTLKNLTKEPLLLLNTLVEGIGGIAMVLTPNLIKNWGSVEIAPALIQTCGLLALSVAFYSYLGAEYIGKSKDPTLIRSLLYASLAVFHSAITIGLFYAVVQGEINYFGVILHLPLAVLFIVSWFMLAKSKAAQ